MKAHSYVFLGLLLLLSAGRATAEDVSVEQAKRSTVLVQGAEYGTGFTILRRGRFSYFITAAHLIDYDAYTRNAALDNASERKAADSWLTVYDPVDGTPYNAELVGEPNFKDDIAVVKVVDLLHGLRPLCVTTAMPKAQQFAVASFTLPTLLSPPIGMPFANQRFAELGMSDTTVLPDADEFELSTFLEQGFSGAPIVDTGTGAVFGIVRRAPFHRDPTTGQWTVSTDTRYAVTIDAIRAYLNSLAVTEPALARITALSEIDRSDLLPNLSDSGKLRLFVFDQPQGPSGLSPVYRAYDHQIRTAISRLFGRSTESAIVDKPTQVFKAGTDILTISDPCSLTRGGEAVGIIGLRRELSSGPGIRRLWARVGLISCLGRIIDAAELAPVTMDSGGPNNIQVTDFINSLQSALVTLDDDSHQRLSAFGSDGLPMNDDEERGFFRIHHDAGVTRISYGWADGSAADEMHLYGESVLKSIEGITSSQLSTLTSNELDSMISNVGGTRMAVFSNSDGSETPIALRAEDRCFYFRRLKDKLGYDYIPKESERKSIL